MPASASLTKGMVIVHGNRMEDLRDVMLSWLQSHPLPPLTPEVLLVQSNGMKQWLVQSMAQQLGVSAGVELYLPSEFLWRAYRQVLGGQQVPKQMAFDKAPLTWRIHRLLDPILASDDEVYQPLRHYLAQNEQAAERRFQLASQIADLYDQYQTYRADWIADWSQGLNQITNQQAESSPLHENTWQAALWRDLQRDIETNGQKNLGQLSKIQRDRGLGEGLHHNDMQSIDLIPSTNQETEIEGLRPSLSSRASVHDQFVQQMRQEQRLSSVKLPQRIVVFGVSSLPQQTLEALSTMAKVAQVLLFVNNPCQYYWGDVQDARYWRRNQLMKAQRHAIKQGLPLKALQEDYASFHPLLAAWGKQGKDYVQLLNEFDETPSHQHWFQRVDVFVEPIDNTRLAELQRHILQLTPPPNEPEARAQDDSICLRSGYSSQREVEMLHDHLLALFDADESLTPADVMVMMPDVDQFAAAVSSVFGRLSAKDKRYIPYSIADSSLRIEPMMQLLQWLLTLPTADIGLSDWHAMFELDAVKAKFQLSETDVESLHQWLLKAGVRWGLDANDRSERHQLPQGINANSWLFGLDRLLLGYACGETGLAWQSILPTSAATGSSADLLGALAEWLKAIRIAQALLSHELPPAIWGCYLEEVLQLFFDESHDLASQRWLTRFRSGLNRWLSACELGQFQQKLPLSVVAKAWLDNIDDAQSLQRPFLSGGVQFATLMPMRAIPFKVICLIGLNERDYPRQQVKQDFDLMALAGQWRAGDRSRRYDDRYLFLEAILSARQQLYLSWTGRSIRDDQHRAPSILVSQFIDYCHQLWTPPLTVVQHPLQPFSQRYVQTDSGVQSYATDWLGEKNDIITDPDWAKVRLADEPLPTTLALSRLSAVLRHPQRVLLRHRLGIKLTQPQEDERDDELFSINPLQQHQHYQQQIEHWLATGRADALPWQLSGTLPLAGFAQLHQQQLEQTSEQLWQTWQTVIAPYTQRLAPLPLSLTLANTTLTGQLDLLYANEQNEQCVVQLVPGELQKDKVIKAYKLIDAWLAHCLANALAQPVTSVILATDAMIRFQPLAPTEARLYLQGYVECYQQAWQQPLKVACKSGIAYVQSLQQQQAKQKDETADLAALQSKALAEARKTFEGGFNHAGERAESLELQRCFATFDELQPEFAELAQRLYGVMLERMISE